jgi:hypothetical protein
MYRTIAASCLLAVMGLRGGGRDADATPTPTPTRARTGRVVTVAGRTPRRLGTPRICIVAEANAASVMCIGKAPVVGERATVLTDHGNAGQVRVREVVPSGPCQIWTFRGEVDQGDLSDAQPYVSYALFDLAVAPTGKIVPTPSASPSGRADQVQAAFDRDGDGVADLLFTTFACDDSANPRATPTDFQCVELWADDGRGMHSLRRDLTSACN